MSGFAPWAVVHVDLAVPPSPLAAPAGHAGVLLVCWWHDLPLAVHELRADALPLTPRQLAALAAELAAPTVAAYLGQQPSERGAGVVAPTDVVAPPSPLARLAGMRAAAPVTDESISVVVCTRDRPGPLADCLASLAALRHPPLEVLVVDNAPDNPRTRAVCEAAGARYVAEPRPGLSVARNTGIRNSRGGIVAFTDDDVVVHHAWLGELRRAFADPATMFVTGLVLPLELEREAQWLFETEFGGFGRKLQPALYDAAFLSTYPGGGGPVWLLGAGANMAFRRRALEQAGGFDERLGAGAAGCSEDSELWYRMLTHGWVARYHPAAVVHHRHRDSDAGLRSQLRAYMRGHVAALLVQFERHRHWGNLWRVVFGLPRHYAGVGARTIVRSEPARRSLLWTEVAGCVAGVAYYVRSRGNRGGGGPS